MNGDLVWPTPGENPGTFTDAVFCTPSSTVLYGDTYLAHVNDARRDYWYGNYIVSKVNPNHSDFDPSALEQVWHRHVGGRPGVQRRIFQWEVPLGEVESASKLVQQAFGVTSEEIGTNLVLVASRQSLIRRESDARVTQVSSREDFRLIEEAAHEDLKHTPESPATTDFLDWKYSEFWTAASRGQCTWWIARNKDGLPCAQCGVALAGGVGRYRDVITHYAQRQKGFGTSLIATTASRVLDGGLCSALVIVAAAGSVAERMYRSVGFQPHSVQVAAHLAV